MSLVSIVVPCYNQALYLPEALQSVLSQTYANWECIIVDDGSPDDTEDSARQFCEKDTRFRYIKKENGGVSSARNFGIAQAAGEFILPLDADDLIHADYIAEAVKYFTKNPRTKLVYCRLRKFGEEVSEPDFGPFRYTDLLIDNMIFCSAVFRKNDFLKTSGYDEGMKIGLEDWEFWIRLLDEESKVKQLPGVYFFYRISKISRNNLLSASIEDIRYYVYLKHIEKYKKHFVSPISIIQENQALKAVYKNSIDYKLGNFIMNPFRKAYYGFRKK